MKKNNLYKYIIAISVATFILTGCSSKEQTPVPTQVATQTPAPTATNTFTPAPTNTPEPTSTPAPLIRTYNLTEYVQAAAISENRKTITIDVSALKTYSANPHYCVTVVFTDGSYVQQKDVISDVDSKITLSFEKEVNKAEATPVFKFSLGKDTNKEEDGFTKVNARDVFSDAAEYGFEGLTDTGTKGVLLKKTDSYFCFAIPDGRYDITVTKAEDGRSTLMINDGAFAVNVGISGTGRKGSDRTYNAKDIVSEGGVARFSVSGSTEMSNITFIRESELIPRKTHVYIAGDSTVATYYPRELGYEPQDGDWQTGWGQLFSRYTTDDIIIDPLGAGGTYAKSWYELYFQGIMNNAMEGDYFFIQEGINDRTYSSTDEMVQYLELMIDKCLEKKVTPVLITSQQTAKFWKDSKGNDLPEYGKPEGSGLFPFAEAIRKLSSDKKVFLVDNAELTSEFYQKIGKTYVEQNYHLYNKKTGKSIDSLHSAYAGSKKIAELIATGLFEQMQSNATDGYGNTLSRLSFNPLTTYTFEYVNSEGVVTSEEITGILFKF